MKISIFGGFGFSAFVPIPNRAIMASDYIRCGQLSIGRYLEIINICKVCATIDGLYIRLPAILTNI